MSVVSNVVHYLDDLCMQKGQIPLTANRRSCCVLPGSFLAQEKTIGPTSVLKFLGLRIDTTHFTVKIPYDKFNRLKSELFFNLTEDLTLSQMQNLTGLC